MHRARRAAWMAVALLLTSAPLSAEIYQWTDAQGRVHFTAHLDKVPPDQRDAARRGARSAGSPSGGSLQIYDSSPAASAPEARGPARATPRRASCTFRSSASER